MSSEKKTAMVRDLVEEAKKRILFLIVCVVGLSYLMSCQYFFFLILFFYLYSFYFLSLFSCHLLITPRLFVYIWKLLGWYIINWRRFLKTKIYICLTIVNKNLAYFVCIKDYYSYRKTLYIGEGSHQEYFWRHKSYWNTNPNSRCIVHKPANHN